MRLLRTWFYSTLEGGDQLTPAAARETEATFGTAKWVLTMQQPAKRDKCFLQPVIFEQGHLGIFQLLL